MNEQSVETEVPCPECAKSWPSVLRKACFDSPWLYELRLSTGEQLRFTGVDYDESDSENALLTGVRFGWYDDFGRWVNGGGPDCGRGVCVRVSNIVWCIDAPEGS